MLFKLTLATLLQLTLARAPAPPPTAKEVVAKVQKYYQDVSQLQANFRQTYDNTLVGTQQTQDGRVYIKKPGKMYWWYKKPEEKFFISDGETLWAYEKAQKQAFKKNIKDELLPTAITFLYGQGDLAKDFDATLDPGAYGGKKDWVVKLTPRQPSAQYKHLWLVVDPTDGHVKESVILEVGGNVNQFKFTNVKQNKDAKDVQDRLFKFVPPKGVKVIEPPKQGEEKEKAKGTE